MSARGITIVNASAGSGKTTRLTRTVTDAVSPKAESPVPLEGLFAVTYTRKAHAELATRIRRKLVQEGAFDRARELPLAYLGTVHAACLRLLQELALDAGISPHIDVVAGDQGKLLRESLDYALPTELRLKLDELAGRTELHWDAQTKRSDWVNPVDKIMNLARSNRIPTASLPSMAARSSGTLLALLKPREKDGAALDAELAKQVDLTLTKLGRGDGKGATEKYLAMLRQAKVRIEDGELRWSDWAKLAVEDASKPLEDKILPLRTVAARYEGHPRLHDDLTELIAAMYRAAAIGLDGYQDWKARQRVVDYVDMLDRTLTLLREKRVREVLSDRLKLAVVDEFQDTSPIQLALFVELHTLVGKSVWVGDRKQCIFEYAGADPQLMDSVAAWVGSDGGSAERLTDNHRSRPELVEACSDLFSHALARHGFSSEEVVVGAKRDSAALSDLPPIGVFRLGTKNQAQAAAALANGILRMVRNPGQTPIVDRTTGERRSVRPGDIAVLVATNHEAQAVASALHERNIRASVARTGLLSTPEGTLADSALRWLLDPRDSLAAAILDALTGFQGRSPEDWLAAVLEDVRRTEPEGEPAPPILPTRGWRKPLAEVRDRLSILSPTEALDATLEALDAIQVCARWPRAPERMANLEALRTLAATYEERCGEEREASTVAGLLRYFDAARRAVYIRSEMVASDDQHVTSDEESVTVCTYHKSKGLEWPVVVLASLDRAERRSAFDVLPQSDAAEFDPQDPLAGRWIHYWPWPFGAKKALPLDGYAAASEQGRDVALREEKERARLLYVGFTRARDHLVLAVPVRDNKDGPKPQTAWLDTLADSKGKPVLALPTEATDGTVAACEIRRADGTTLSVPGRVWHLDANLSGDLKGLASAAPTWFARPESIAPRLPYRINPSQGAADWPELERAATSAQVATVERLTGTGVLAEKMYDYGALGTAAHAFLAADVEGLLPETRIACAEGLLTAASLTGVVRGDALVKASDALRTWVEGRWPGARWHRELPVEALVPSDEGERRVVGIVDLLLETEEGVVIVDHKTFPGATEASWRMKALEVADQLFVYAHVLRQAGRKVLGLWVHLPMGGGMVELVVP